MIPPEPWLTPLVTFSLYAVRILLELTVGQRVQRTAVRARLGRVGLDLCFIGVSFAAASVLRTPSRTQSPSRFVSTCGVDPACGLAAAVFTLFLYVLAIVLYGYATSIPAVRRPRGVAGAASPPGPRPRVQVGGFPWAGVDFARLAAAAGSHLLGFVLALTWMNQL